MSIGTSGSTRDFYPQTEYATLYQWHLNKKEKKTPDKGIAYSLAQTRALWTEADKLAQNFHRARKDLSVADALASQLQDKLSETEKATLTALQSGELQPLRELAVKGGFPSFRDFIRNLQENYQVDPGNSHAYLVLAVPQILAWADNAEDRFDAKFQELRQASELLEEARQSNAELQRLLEEKTAQTQKVTKELSELRDHSRRASTESGVNHQELVKLRESDQELRKQLLKLQSQNEEVKKERNRLLENTVVQHRQALDTKDQEITSLETRLAGSKQACQELAEEVAELTARVEELEESSEGESSRAQSQAPEEEEDSEDPPIRDSGEGSRPGPSAAALGREELAIVKEKYPDWDLKSQDEQEAIRRQRENTPGGY